MRTPISQLGRAKVFLGGTTAGEDWREKIKPNIRCDYFDPFIRDGEWTEENFKEELEERKLICSHFVYVYTPASVGMYTIAEMVEDSILRTKQTMVCFLEKDGDATFDEQQKASIDKVKRMIAHYHNNIYDNLDDLLSAINSIA